MILCSLTVTHLIVARHSGKTLVEQPTDPICICKNAALKKSQKGFIHTIYPSRVSNTQPDLEIAPQMNKSLVNTGIQIYNNVDSSDHDLSSDEHHHNPFEILAMRLSQLLLEYAQ